MDGITVSGVKNMIDKTFFAEPKKSETTNPTLEDLLSLLGQFEVLSEIKFLSMRVDTDFCGTDNII